MPVTRPTRWSSSSSRPRREGATVTSTPAVVVETSIPGLPLRRGKVRDIYDLTERTGQPLLLIVASDRISAFDVVLPTGIPSKGRVLTGLSLFWFDHLADLADTHFVTADLSALGLSEPEEARPLSTVGPGGRNQPGSGSPAIHQDRRSLAEQLAGRSMVVRTAQVLPVECVVRGYLAGSGWREYQASGAVCGIELPTGLREGDQLPEPIFTPTTKAESGHDQVLTFDQVVEMVDGDRAEEVRDRSTALYTKAAEYARGRGIIIADTKFEWGVVDGEVILVDEVLTPDSSRFWPAHLYDPGRSQPSFDKQFVRDYLDTLDWDKTPPGPELPAEVVAKTAEKYISAYEQITGRRFER